MDELRRGCSGWWGSSGGGLEETNIMNELRRMCLEENGHMLNEKQPKKVENSFTNSKQHLVTQFNPFQ